MARRSPAVGRDAALPPSLRTPLRAPRNARGSVLHGIITENLETLLAQARDDNGAGLPAYVERELRGVVPCGEPAAGFLRMKCERCGQEVLCPLSCGSRTALDGLRPPSPTSRSSSRRTAESPSRCAKRARTAIPTTGAPSPGSASRRSSPARLAWLIVPPRQHLVRYEGVLAPAAHWRRLVVLDPCATGQHSAQSPRTPSSGASSTTSRCPRSSPASHTPGRHQTPRPSSEFLAHERRFPQGHGTRPAPVRPRHATPATRQLPPCPSAPFAPSAVPHADREAPHHAGLPPQFRPSRYRPTAATCLETLSDP